MNVAFLANCNSMHINIKAKYFRNFEHVFFFAMESKRRNHFGAIEPKHDRRLCVIRCTESESIYEYFHSCLNIRKIVKENGIEVVHIIDMQYYWYVILLRVMGIKVIIENNGSDVLRLPEQHPELKKFYWITYHLCNAVIQDSYIVKERAIELGATTRMNEVIELGIDTDVFHPNVIKGEFRKKKGIPDSAPIIFSPRAFTKLYNIDEIIEIIEPIIQKFPDSIFVFCSYVNDRRYLARINELNRPNNIIMLGYVDNEKEMPFIYADSNVVISIPSSDSSPRTVYEAMACGSTAIVSDLPWINGKFIRGEDLLAVPLHDRKALEDCVVQAIKTKKNIEVQQVYRKVKSMLDYRISAKKIRKLYCNLLNGK